MTDIKFLDTDELQQAYDHSWYTIAGCGGDLDAWVKGVEHLLAKEGIGKPTAWYQTNGAAVNLFAAKRAPLSGVDEKDQFKGDLILLLFPLDGLSTKLPLFKMQMQDRWFDDVIDNMVRRWA